MDELRDIKPIIDYAPGLPWWVWVVALAMIVVVAFVLWRRRRPALAPPASPDHTALVALQALAGMTPVDAESALRLQTQLSMIVRTWIEARFAVRATDMTTEEIASSLDVARELGTAARETLLGVLTFADDVRFAGAVPAVSEHAAAIARARELVARMAVAA